MRDIYKPLKTEFKPQYGIFSKDEIEDRVNSEDWYTFCKGYPLTKVEKRRKVESR